MSQVWPELIKNLTPLVETIEAARKPKGTVQYLVGLGNHAIAQVKRLAEWENDDIDKVAWAVRNLYEIRLQIGFLFKHPEGTEKLSWLVGHDYSKILAALMSIGPNDEAEDLTAQLAASLTKSLRESPHIDFEGYKHFKRMADYLKDAEYETLYRMLSVLTHPSLYLVAPDEQFTFKPEHVRTILLATGIRYAAEIEEVYKMACEQIDEFRQTMPEAYND